MSGYGYLNLFAYVVRLLFLDSKVILAIRKAEHLKKLIYVSCNPRAAMNNFVE